MLDQGETRLVPVHVCWSDSEADIVMSFLASNEIEAITSSRLDHTVFPITADGLGEIQILVAEENAERAVALLRECEIADAAAPDASGEPAE